MKDSPYYGPFADEAEAWELKLTSLDSYLHHLNQIQRKWVYLEPIFGRGALPQERARFANVDEQFREIMFDVQVRRRNGDYLEEVVIDFVCCFLE